MINLLAFISVFVLSWLGVGVFVRWTETRQIVDIPNERSSHTKPIPIGGGLVIVFFTISALAIYEGFAGQFQYWPFYLGGVLIAGVSWIDDVKPLPAILRLTVHVIAAVAFISQIGFYNEITIWGGITLNVGYFKAALIVIWIVWMTNAYNFMDGIDGLAGTQAVIASAGWAVFSFYAGMDFLLFASIVVMASASGFLVHNWPPAKVFMGDVGSAFLGYTFGVFPVIAFSANSAKVYPGMIAIATVGFVWLFFSDSVVTIFRRAIKREKLWTAHQEHFYQRLILAGRSHLFVTVLYGVLMAITVSAVLYGLFLDYHLFSISSLFIVFVTLTAFVFVNNKYLNKTK